MIETERLTLRPFDSGDLDIVMALYGDEERAAFKQLCRFGREAALAAAELYEKRGGAGDIPPGALELLRSGNEHPLAGLHAGDKVGLFSHAHGIDFRSVIMKLPLSAAFFYFG